MITDLGLVRPKIKSIVKFHQNILRLLEAVRVVGLVQPVQQEGEKGGEGGEFSRL